jgi:putative photosynthetic complex assembly protein 2
LQYGGSNRTGLLTFLLLWVMQRSAKLNVLLGVRNLQVELLPQHLHYLASYWRRRPTNLFFFPSVVAGMALAGWCLVRAGQLAPNGAAVGLTLLGCLTALAVLEHWMLVLPWPRKEV